MAELATIARPYAEALHAAAGAEAPALKDALNALAALTRDEGLRQFAADPRTSPSQVFDLIAGVAQGQGLQIGSKLANLLRAVIENGRLAALPEVAAQFAERVNASGGVAEALVQTAYPIDAAQWPAVQAALEKRFGSRIEARVEVVPELIGGIRVQVGDEVLDTSVKARLEQMRLALTA